jgi:peptide/nickel transport system permease protein
MFDGFPRPIALPLLWLVMLHCAAMFAGFLSPYDPSEQRRLSAMAPPTPIHWIYEGSWHSRPFVCQLVPNRQDATAYSEDCKQRYPVRILVRRSQSLRLFGVDEPGAIHIMGTDRYGRDQFSRFLHGARLSLFAGIFACLLSLSVSLLVGTLAGYFGGRLDDFLMWMAEIFVSLPWLYLLFAVRAFLPLNLEPAVAFLAIVCVIGLAGWARTARLIRGVTLSAKEREYVLAARGFGASDGYIIRRHILPATKGILLTQASFLIPRYVLAEITLSFFGLGVNEPSASWGQMLGLLSQYHILSGHYYWMFVPALLLVITCYSYLAISDALRGDTKRNNGF